MLEITVSGSQAVIDKLMASKDMIDAGFKEPLAEIGKDLVKYFSKQPLQSRGGVFGTPWAKLAQSTQAGKKLHYRQYVNVPLMRTGKMMKSFNSKVEPLGLVISNSVPYFKYHQSTASRHKIPWRPMMLINQPVKDMIQTTISEYINAQLGEL